MRIPILLMAVTALALAACDSRDTDAVPVGVRATVDGQPFRAGLTMGWSMSGTATPLSISGATMEADGMRMILLSVPGRVGTYTASSPETSAGYARSTPADTTMEMWMAGGGAPDTRLEIRVTTVDAAHAKGTFSFTARNVDDPSRIVTVTGGTFNVPLQELPDGPHALSGRRNAILDAAQAFERTPQRPDAR